MTNPQRILTLCCTKHSSVFQFVVLVVWPTTSLLWFTAAVVINHWS